MKNKKNWLSIIVIVVILIAVNIIGKYVFHRFDFTADKRFTLTDKTKKVLKNSEPFFIEVIDLS